MTTHPLLSANSRLLRFVAAARPGNRADVVIWTTITVTAAASLIAVSVSGFRIRPTPLLAQLLGAALGFGLLAWLMRRNEGFSRLRAVSVAACQLFLMLTIVKPLHYVLMATDLPAVDDDLAAIDRWLGLGWPLYVAFVQHWTWLDWTLEQIYVQNFVHTVGVLIVVANVCGVGRLREMAGLATLTSLITVSLAWLVPALGAHVFYGHPDAVHVGYLPDLLALRSGEMRSVDFVHVNGVAACPSYHTVMALIFIVGSLGNRLLAPIVIVVEIGMLMSIPIYGSHHFSDMIAGAAVFAVVLFLWRRWVGPPERLRPDRTV